MRPCGELRLTGSQLFHYAQHVFTDLALILCEHVLLISGETGDASC